MKINTNNTQRAWPLAIIAIASITYLYRATIRSNNTINGIYSEPTVHDLVIIGSGPAAASAAMYAARARITKTITLEGEEIGGKLTRAVTVENLPGTFSISGADLAHNMLKQAKNLGAHFISESAQHIDLSQRPFLITTNTGRTILSHTLILATGSRPTKLNCAGEEEYTGRGVAFCAACDGALCKDKPIVVVGNGFYAIKEAGALSRFTQDITILNPDKKFTTPAAHAYVMENNPHIKIINNIKTERIIGNGTHVTGLEIRNNETGKKEFIPAYGIFVAIGNEPESALVKGQLALNAQGNIKVSNWNKTAIEGVYAAGDVTDYPHRQVIIAAAAGYDAAMYAEEYLNTLNTQKT
jgi:thioredoxin reductase (NADPH)